MTDREVAIDSDAGPLLGFLSIPVRARGLVLFVHGSGSSRFSSRNQRVARDLQRAGLATLLFDLLTADEESVDEVTRELRFDIPLLTRRVEETLDFVARRPDTRPLPVGLFGASTGAAAALVAAADRADVVKAVVSRGGRPDLAEEALPHVRAPTLLLVGELDDVVIALNEEARAAMHAEVVLVIVQGATHLFEEPGTLDEVSRQARDWFVHHLGTGVATELPRLAP